MLTVAKIDEITFYIIFLKNLQLRSKVLKLAGGF